MTTGYIHAERDARQIGSQIIVQIARDTGALLFDGESTFSAPAFPVEEVADPTGAGDSFAGGLLGYLAHEDRVDGSTLRRAVIHGSVVASFSAAGLGSLASA